MQYFKLIQSDRKIDFGSILKFDILDNIAFEYEDQIILGINSNLQNLFVRRGNEFDHFRLYYNYYHSFSEGGQSSGAYIFRPNSKESRLYSKPKEAKVYKGINVLQISVILYDFRKFFVILDLWRKTRCSFENVPKIHS